MAFDMNKLVSPEFQAMMHREAKENKQTSGKGRGMVMEGEIDTSMSRSASQPIEYDRFDAAMPNVNYLSEADMMAQQGGMQIQQKTYTEGVDPFAYRDNPNSKLPPAILATLKKNQGLTEQAAIAQGQTSGIAQLAAKVKKTQVVEQQQPTVAPAPMMGGVDYTALKAIIKECLDEKFNEYAKQTLNESSLRTIAIKNGNKIRLVDNSGNIFSATLERTGNVNDKKK